ncbi:MAG: tRNA (adenosine(37)-N6)-dimethylallyltransferase MiaA [Anaerolineales bacterium]|nr:tRNA (adenosine(37)-N6)-dimethylallyltransferase MiaA [Anaerolineales bacterium]
MDNTRKLVMVVGPTGVGKTECAYQLALTLDGEIVSIDSRYLYRGMDIGTAKPDIQLRKRVQHHLVDVADPNETWSLAIFQNRVSEALEEIFIKGKLPILVGGTGQYYRAILEGWQPPPVPPNPPQRAMLERWLEQLQPEERLRRLATLDPAAAKMIDPHNLRRVVRAFEVIFSTGVPFSQQRKKVNPISYPIFVVGLTLPRHELYQKCDQRIYQMIDAGWVKEVQKLLSKGYTPDLPSFSAIGYREIAAYISGSMSMEEVITHIKRRTRTLIRRQSNWFRLDDPIIHWFVVNDRTVIEIQVAIQEWLEQISTQDERR